MPVVRKVQSKITLNKEVKPEEEKATKAVNTSRPVKATSVEDEAKKMGVKPKRGCTFCKSKSEPHYYDAASLRRCINDRGRIYPRSRSGACAKHQRRVGKEVKRARHLALLPFKVAL